MGAIGIKLQAVPGGKIVELVAMSVVHFSRQHIDGLGAALLGAWQYICLGGQRHQIWLYDNPAGRGVDMSQKTRFMTRQTASLLGRDPFTTFCVDHFSARVKLAEKSTDRHGQRRCKGLQCLERGRGIAIFNLGQHSNGKSRAVDLLIYGPVFLLVSYL